MGDELQNHGASHETPGDLVDDSVFGASNTAAPWLHMTPSVSGSVALATGTSTNGTPQSTSKTRHDSGLSLSELGMGEAHGVVRLTDTIEGWASTQSVKSAEVSSCLKAKQCGTKTAVLQSWKRRYVRLQRKESLLLIYHHAEEVWKHKPRCTSNKVSSFGGGGGVGQHRHEQDTSSTFPCAHQSSRWSTIRARLHRAV